MLYFVSLLIFKLFTLVLGIEECARKIVFWVLTAKLQESSHSQSRNTKIYGNYINKQIQFHTWQHIFNLGSYILLNRTIKKLLIQNKNLSQFIFHTEAYK